MREEEIVPVRCPYCGEVLELYLEADLHGRLVQDCEVCCNPIALDIRRDEWGDPVVTAERAD